MPTIGGPPADEAARTFPADAPHTPGTVASIAGGYCDGYPARDATISPTRVSLDSSARAWWADNDGTSRSDIPERRTTPSVYIRHVDAAGRVRTLATTVVPEEGRAFRMDPYGTWLTDVVPDNHGGAYVDVNPYSFSQPADRCCRGDADHRRPAG